MIELSVGATTVAHGVHYAVLGVGFLGLLALLGPQLVGGRRATTGADEHTLRVLALADQISVGGLGVTVTPTLPRTWPRPAAIDHVGARYLPIAVVSSAAAAGVHAAVGPAHFREGLAFGMFFAVAGLAQVGWALAMAVRPSRSLLVAAVVGNSAVLLLWLVTRTIGLPGLMAGPESVGLWDLSCGIWELAVIVAAGQVLHARPRTGFRIPPWSDWEPPARAWALGSASVLPALALFGVGA